MVCPSCSQVADLCDQGDDQTYEALAQAGSELGGVNLLELVREILLVDGQGRWPGKRERSE